MDNLYCTGAENSLSECRFDGWGSNDCTEAEAAGVVCESGLVLETESPPVIKAPRMSIQVNIENRHRRILSWNAVSVCHKIRNADRYLNHFRTYQSKLYCENPSKHSVMQPGGHSSTACHVFYFYGEIMSLWKATAWWFWENYFWFFWTKFSWSFRIFWGLGTYELFLAFAWIELSPCKNSHILKIQK